VLEDHGGDATAVPQWQSDDFDSLYVVRIARAEAGATATFERKRQGLDGQSLRCPG
jgi:hypothetical protein